MFFRDWTKGRSPVMEIAMSSALLVRQVRIVSEDSSQFREADVLVLDGVISEIGEGLVGPEGTQVIEGRGRLLMPAMFDAHVHFREPGFEAKEDIASGCDAAINGGITGIVMMPNTSPAIDSPSVVKMLLDKARAVSPIEVYTSGCITKGRAGKELAAIDGMRSLGVKMLTDDGDGIADPAVLYRAMEYAGEFGMFFASHCEVHELAGPRALNDGPTAYRLGIKGSPACAEEIMIDRDIRLAHATGAHIHIQHVSSKLGMETIRWWKQRGDVKVTAEVAPHHLMFKDEDIGDYDTHYKMNPPLRTAEDNAALLQGLKEGVFDLIATDHAPHTPFEKSQDFTSAPNGITGLETALISLYDRYVTRGELNWDLIVKRYSAEPRRLMGLEPVPIALKKQANFILFDPEGETTFTPEYMRSKSRNTPFLNQTLKGSIDLVVLGSKVLLER
jgi:dihydroorotase